MRRRRRRRRRKISQFLLFGRRRNFSVDKGTKSLPLSLSLPKSSSSFLGFDAPKRQKSFWRRRSRVFEDARETRRAVETRATDALRPRVTFFGTSFTFESDDFKEEDKRKRDLASTPLPAKKARETTTPPSRIPEAFESIVIIIILSRRTPSKSSSFRRPPTLSFERKRKRNTIDQRRPRRETQRTLKRKLLGRRDDQAFRRLFRRRHGDDERSTNRGGDKGTTTTFLSLNKLETKSARNQKWGKETHREDQRSLDV